MTNDTPTPAENPNLVRWTPADGPLADALADLSDGHEVTVTVPVYMAAAMTGAATSASWLPPAPAWDGALVVIDCGGDSLLLRPDGGYSWSPEGERMTAAEVEAKYGPCTVYIDADGNHVEVPHA